VQIDIRASAATPLRARFAFQARPSPAFGITAGRGARSDVRPFPLFFALFFPLIPIVISLIPIVLAPAIFLSLAQGLALYLGQISHCKLPVFYLADPRRNQPVGALPHIGAPSEAKSAMPTGISVIIGFVLRVGENG
jgi:hypothetical protein